MLYLVDGYNLLYTLGWLKKGGDASAAERARQALLQRILGALGSEASKVLVLFDAARAPRARPRQEQHGPLRVLYSPHCQDADSVIEELLRGYLASRVVVVSADHRLKRAAQRRRCQHWSPEEFLAWLEKRRAQRLASDVSHESDKEKLAAHDKESWLRKFAHLAHDPTLGQLEPFAELEMDSLLDEIPDDNPHYPEERRSSR